MRDNMIHLVSITADGQTGWVELSPYLNVFERRSDIHLPEGKEVADLQCSTCGFSLKVEGRHCDLVTPPSPASWSEFQPCGFLSISACVRAATGIASTRRTSIESFWTKAWSGERMTETRRRNQDYCVGLPGGGCRGIGCGRLPRGTPPEDATRFYLINDGGPVLFEHARHGDGRGRLCGLPSRTGRANVTTASTATMTRTTHRRRPDHDELLEIHDRACDALPRNSVGRARRSAAVNAMTRNWPKIYHQSCNACHLATAPARFAEESGDPCAGLATCGDAEEDHESARLSENTGRPCSLPDAGEAAIRDLPDPDEVTIPLEYPGGWCCRRWSRRDIVRRNQVIGRSEARELRPCLHGGTVREISRIWTASGSHVPAVVIERGKVPDSELKRRRCQLPTWISPQPRACPAAQGRWCDLALDHAGRWSRRRTAKTVRRFAIW